MALTPIRRVVTGNDARGRSQVIWDGPAPNAHEASMGSGRGHTDLWVWNECPAPLSGSDDAGNLPYVFSGPAEGGHEILVGQWVRGGKVDRTAEVVPLDEELDSSREVLLMDP